MAYNGGDGFADVNMRASRRARDCVPERDKWNPRPAQKFSKIALPGCPGAAPHPSHRDGRSASGRESRIGPAR